MRFADCIAVAGIVLSSSVSGSLTWGTTKNLFVFGDSYS